MLNLQVSTYKIEPSTILVEAFSTCVDPSELKRAGEKVLLCHLVDGHGTCNCDDGREPKKCCCEVPPLHALVLYMMPLSNLDWMSWGLSVYIFVGRFALGTILIWHLQNFEIFWHPLPPCPHLVLIYIILFTLPPLLHILLGDLPSPLSVRTW